MVSISYEGRSHPLPAVRRIGGADLHWALREGWRDFTRHRGDLLIVGLLYPVIGLVAAALALRAELVPLIFPLAAGLSLMGPVVAAGFYELARRDETGEESNWTHFFHAYTGPAFRSIAIMAACLAILFAMWLGAAYGIYEATFGARQPISIGEFVGRLFTTGEGWTLFFVGNLVGLLFAIVVLTVSVVSLPMIVDKRVDVYTAVGTSIRAVWHNPAAMAVWGLIVAALLAAGMLLLLIGLAVVLPWLGYATWHLYTRVVER
jgi:uncharacterized membrane protein